MEVATHKDAQRKSKRQWAQVISREMSSGYRKKNLFTTTTVTHFPEKW